MNRRAWRVFVIWVVGIGGVRPGLAGQFMLLPRDLDAKWTIISLPLAEAPTEKAGSRLMTSIRFFSAGQNTVVLRSPADARRARMAAEHMHLYLNRTSDILFFPDREKILIYPEKSTLEF